ncbi:hypothetical protein CBE37_01600 [bacterium TMED277]|nr:MAG: hypothetical protein CBE37_01600 [bacterium TMED277]PQM63588.1 MAG: cell shape determination protein CcmA [Paracoccaceae bacterium]|tara:strand:- start:1288 stop:1779 length:492 start_codon:yes stop_codon:yes gene_type:complete
MFFSRWKRKKVEAIKKNPTDKKNEESISNEMGQHEDINKKQTKQISPSHLGKDIKISGKIITEGELQIDGIVEGEIEALKLVIEQSAKIIGSVSSEDLVIKGRIIGPVYGKKVRFGATARVEGDTFHETIAIEDGAYYEGSIKRHGSLNSVSNLLKNRAASNN